MPSRHDEEARVADVGRLLGKRRADDVLCGAALPLALDVSLDVGQAAREAAAEAGSRVTEDGRRDGVRDRVSEAGGRRHGRRQQAGDGCDGFGGGEALVDGGLVEWRHHGGGCVVCMFG